MTKQSKQEETTATVRRALGEMGLKFIERPGGSIVFPINGMSGYRNGQGEGTGLFAIVIKEGGELVSVEMPQIYTVPADHVHRGAFFQLTAALSFRWKLLSYGYDPSDGEVRVRVDLVVEKGELAVSQVRRALGCLVQAADENHAALVRALEEGVCELPKADGEGLLEQMMRMVAANPELGESVAATAARMQELATALALRAQASSDGEEEGGGEEPGAPAAVEEDQLAAILGD